MWSSLLKRFSKRSKTSNNNTSSHPIIKAESASLPGSNSIPPDEGHVRTYDAKPSAENTNKNNTLPKHVDVIPHSGRNNAVSSTIDRSEFLMKNTQEKPPAHVQDTAKAATVPTHHFFHGMHHSSMRRS